MKERGTMDPFVHVKAEFTQECLMGQVGRRDAMFDAPVNDIQYFGALAIGQMRIEKRFQPVQRKMQCMQDKVGSFIIGIAAAVPEKQFGLVEAAHRETQIVAHGVQVKRGL